MHKAPSIHVNSTFSILHEILNSLGTGEYLNDPRITDELKAEFFDGISQSRIVNPWFTPLELKRAFEGLAFMLKPSSLAKWMASYDQQVSHSKRIGLVLAGNIPMVGFHDVFSVAVSGHQAVVKPSQQDSILLPLVFKTFYELTQFDGFKVEWVTAALPQVDAVIATGSNNTARYFEYYFSSKPHIIRKNRSSIAIVNGTESDAELADLGTDIFAFYGMGCRNVSKLYVHQNFDINRFFQAIYPWHDIVNHHKYANNYDYYRALWMMNREDLLDNGFLILRPSTAIASPVATLFYERYENEDTLRKMLLNHSNEIQCVVSKQDTPFGKSQRPEIWDYADGMDTMAFLKSL